MRRRHILISTLLVQSAFAMPKPSRLPAFISRIPPLAFQGYRHHSSKNSRPLRLAPHNHNGVQAATCLASTGPTMSSRGPLAREEKTTSNHHGIVREDLFAWMKDDNWQNVRAFPHPHVHRLYSDPVYLGFRWPYGQPLIRLSCACGFCTFRSVWAHKCS